MTNIIFLDNLCEDKGGAIECGGGAPVITHCVFMNNTGGIGGAICAEGPAVIRDCVFIGNSVDHTEYGGYGGAIALRGAASAQIINCSISGNTAPDGSGIRLDGSGTITLTNSIVAFNGRDAAVSGTGGIDLFHTDVFGNEGGDWIGPIAGQGGLNGNLALDPLFVDGEAGDLHLQYFSPCRDAGDGAASGLPDTDIEGDPRVAGGYADMGADEFHIHLYVTGECAPGSRAEVKVVGKPGQEVLLWVGSDLLDTPLTTSYGAWYLQGILPPVYLGSTSRKGTVSLGKRIPPDCPVPFTLCLQSLVRRHLTNAWAMEIR